MSDQEARLPRSVLLPRGGGEVLRFLRRERRERERGLTPTVCPTVSVQLKWVWTPSLALTSLKIACLFFSCLGEQKVSISSGQDARPSAIQEEEALQP